ncbi:cytochrome b560 subunit of succinate dehydrogenase [Aspergillus heteromorphus CBS 117.55]|uniref:Cytochrome b560 subunit of succinate dehydrogenase n=1 Tax=Aspergillus heteromorphus CBS 117.55 TaxID=1448321 RepID=A0A317VBR1_9EURO|nr:cytochrome b560 subunit of succinate dehydrogenase [Aspergillus heteromorphus CBS 117.55]PWY70507.1 cytochrome b560 subunit of succinate dehydrogenase [Aspergillus heteromorphus CBS 117.55]
MALLARNILSLPQKRPALLAVLARQQQLQQQQLRWTTTNRKIQITPQTPAQAQALLAQQRLRRPVSPHLQIYKWQVNSVSSALERNTGILFSGGLYLFATSYLIAPYLGWDLSSTTLVAAVAGLPVVAKLALKFAIAWPFTFHVVNGVRYLATSGARTIASKGQIVGVAWGVVGVSFLGAVGLVAFY